MAITGLKAGLYFIGIAAILIGGAIALLGIAPVGLFFSTLINFIYDAGPLTGLGQPNDDSELRFYSVFFVAYGFILTQTAHKITLYSHRVPALLALFFAGGLVRGLSYFTVGPPHALFILLLCIELILPPILYCLWRRIH